MADAMKNINLNLSTKQKFTIDGDPNRVIELDISDLNIIDRAATAIKNMEKLQEEWEKLPVPQEIDEDTVDIEALDTTISEVQDFSAKFSKIEDKVKQEINFMFDSDISDTIFGKTSPFAVINGKFKFQHTVDVLMSLYENQIQSDVKKLNRQKVVNKTQRYIKR